MNIHAEKCAKIVYDHPDYGYDADQQVAGTYLRVGARYTVDHVRVGGWVSYVYLLEVPNIGFNTVLFSDVVTSQS